MKQYDQTNIDNIENLDREAQNLGLGGKISPENTEKRYKERMEKRKNIQLERIKIRKEKKGLILVFTGNGKGKTTAALGIALRTLGHNQKVAIIQFIKGSWTTGEEKALKIFKKSISWHSLGEGFTWETQDRLRDEELVRNAWGVAKKYIKDETYKLVILDEINIALKLGYIKSEEIISSITKYKDRDNHIVLTGRGAPKSIIEFADLVSEINVIKHPFKEQGIKAQECIEF
tara:strand:- start:43497 stop:44192 length:696 start_codon:yes stop_codon:yes gene_type:complete